MAKKILRQAPFKKMLKTRSIQKIGQLNSSSTRLLFWNEKISFEGETISNDNENSIKVKMSFFGDDVKPFLVTGQKFSVSFKHGIHYFFAQVNFLTNESEGYKFEIFNNQLYKFERRKKDRLRIFPYKKIDLIHGENKTGNVIPISFNKKFKNLTSELILNSESAKPPKEILQFNLPVYDIGMNGISVLIDDKDSKSLKPGIIIKDLSLNYKENNILISEVQVVYNISFIENEARPKRCKIGLNITNPHEDPIKWFFQTEKETYVSEEERVLFQKFIVSV